MPTGISKQGSNLHVDGYPNAERTAAVDWPEARELEDLRLHQMDLRQVQQWLTSLPAFIQSQDGLNAYAYWLTAVVRYAVCFGSGARQKLDPKLVFASRPELLPHHEYFWNIRSKSLAHDVNAFSLSASGLALNPRGTEPRVIEALSVMLQKMPSEDEVGLLDELVRVALENVSQAVEAKAVEVVERARKLSDDEIDALPPMQIKAPDHGEEKTSRLDRGRGT